MLMLVQGGFIAERRPGERGLAHLIEHVAFISPTRSGDWRAGGPAPAQVFPLALRPERVAPVSVAAEPGGRESDAT